MHRERPKVLNIKTYACFLMWSPIFIHNDNAIAMLLSLNNYSVRSEQRLAGYISPANHA